MKIRRDRFQGHRKRNKNEQDCTIDLTQAEIPVKKEMKCIIDVDDMIDLTKSPVKYNSEPETEMGDIELERRSTVSDMGLQLDIIKDAMRGCQEEDGSSDTESAEEPVPGTSSEVTRPMNVIRWLSYVKFCMAPQIKVT